MERAYALKSTHCAHSSELRVGVANGAMRRATHSAANNRRADAEAELARLGDISLFSPQIANAVRWLPRHSVAVALAARAEQNRTEPNRTDPKLCGAAELMSRTLRRPMDSSRAAALVSSRARRRGCPAAQHTGSDNLL